MRHSIRFNRRRKKQINLCVHFEFWQVENKFCMHFALFSFSFFCFIFSLCFFVFLLRSSSFFLFVLQRRRGRKGREGGMGTGLFFFSFSFSFSFIRLLISSFFSFSFSLSSFFSSLFSSSDWPSWCMEGRVRERKEKGRRDFFFTLLLHLVREDVIVKMNASMRGRRSLSPLLSSSLLLSSHLFSSLLPSRSGGTPTLAVTRPWMRLKRNPSPSAIPHPSRSRRHPR